MTNLIHIHEKNLKKSLILEKKNAKFIQQLFLKNFTNYYLDFQKEWLKLYPEILHLDGTHDTNSEKYVLHTFLSQVNVILFFTKIFQK